MTVNDNFAETFIDFLNNVGAALGQEVIQLWRDAWELYDKVERLKDPHKIEPLLRAVVLTASAGFEAFTNFLAYRLVQAGEVAGHRLTESEMDCLEEKQRVLENGKITARKKLYSAKERYLLLFRLLGGNEDLPHNVRTELDNSFKIRDQLVHPKPGQPVKLAENEGLNGMRAFYGFLNADLHLWKLWRENEFSPAASAAGELCEGTASAVPKRS